MSRAFITDKEDWIYCPKAGEQCMHAEEGKTCSETGYEYFDKQIKPAARSATSVSIVKRKTKETKPAAEDKPSQRRTTKKSTLKKPRKWGGRTME